MQAWASGRGVGGPGPGPGLGPGAGWRGAAGGRGGKRRYHPQAVTSPAPHLAALPSAKPFDRASGHGQRVALLGLSINLLLALAKLLAGVIGHSYALIADAVESLTDILGSLIVVGGLRYAERPADDDHPYGHGKAEALSALAVGGILLIAGLGIGVQAIREAMVTHPPPAAFTLWVLLGVIAIKETLFRIARASARKSGSSAVLADAWHHRSDAITSLAALTGIILALWGGPAWAVADKIAAAVAALIIVVNAVLIARGPLGELLDTAPSSLIEEVRRVAQGVPGVRAVEKVLARKSGPWHLVDMHLHVDPEMPVRDAHALGGRVKATIRAHAPTVRDVLIHVEPAENGPGGPPATL